MLSFPIESLARAEKQGPGRLSSLFLLSRQAQDAFRHVYRALRHSGLAVSERKRARPSLKNEIAGTMPGDHVTRLKVSGTLARN
jgi:hypothetical protein